MSALMHETHFHRSCQAGVESASCIRFNYYLGLSVLGIQLPSDPSSRKHSSPVPRRCLQNLSEIMVSTQSKLYRDPTLLWDRMMSSGAKRSVWTIFGFFFKPPSLWPSPSKKSEHKGPANRTSMVSGSGLMYGQHGGELKQPQRTPCNGRCSRKSPGPQFRKSLLAPIHITTIQ